MPQETCWTLIQAAQRGSPEQREEFGRRYLPAVRAYLTARWRGGPMEGELEDGIQEVFIACFREGGALERVQRDTERGFRGFLFGVVRNVALHLERTQARRSARQDSPPDSRLPADDPGLSMAFDRGYARSIMREAASLMASRAQDGDAEARRRVALLELRFEEGLPIREIALRWEVEANLLHNEYAKAGREFRSALRHVVGLNERCAPERLDRECDRLLALLG